MDTRIFILNVSLIVLLLLLIVPRGVLGTSASKVNTLSLFVFSGGEFLRTSRLFLRTLRLLWPIPSLSFRLIFRVRGVGGVLRGI